ncbi:hypothetical protein TYRP_014150 [Tyrophagus putrescentiae]|nr:hypothetical protein TYRP_014150 [Tyrophagus putrescentiae]
MWLAHRHQLKSAWLYLLEERGKEGVHLPAHRHLEVLLGFGEAGDQMRRDQSVHGGFEVLRGVVR